MVQSVRVKLGHHGARKVLSPKQNVAQRKVNRINLWR